VSSGTEQEELERMLAASRELRTRYRAESQEDPSAHVDDAIRAHARRAVGARPRSAGSPFGGSWRVPLSIAAVLVLSVTLTVMVTRQEKHLPSAEQPAARDTLSEHAPAAAPAETQTPQAESQPPPAAKPSADAKENALGKRHKSRATRAPEQQAPPAKDLSRAPTPAPSFDESAARGELKKQAEPFPASPAAPVPAPPAAAPPPTPGAAPSPRAEPAPSSVPESKVMAPAAPVPEQERDSIAAGGAAVDAPRQRSLADAGVKPLSSNAAQAPAKLKAEEATGSLEARVAPQRRQAAAEETQTRAASAAAPWESDPKAWLRHIETLVRDKRMTEARDSLKAFRQRYPSYQLPAEFPLREP